MRTALPALISTKFLVWTQVRCPALRAAFLLIFGLLVGMEISHAAEEPGIQVPEGFQVESFADDDLAHDIHSLSIDSLGRICVSGPGYVRILIDSDNDGKADAVRQFADLPKTGSQGMFWLGRNLMCAGDDGLLLFRDENRDDRADGPPQVFLKIAAGGEHHVHSVQKGPDGWYYVIAGNFAGVTSAYATLPGSPLKKPVNGVLFRLKPDLSGGEILCDGMRNAYDFAFNSQGDVFTYDSDDERDVSLPWYLPTRAIHLLPMSNSGWVSAGWKRPGRFADMPPVMGEFGRGSPTGVVCYQHTQFPEKYRGGLFVLDWTLGRIHTLPLNADGARWTSQPEQFAAGKDQFGFAPTDLEVGPDGSLYVSVGGRGTRGSVYRISSINGKAATLKPVQALAGESDSDRLNRVLKADQPLSSWSRAVWTPIAKRLGADAFRVAALDEGRAVPQRIRAIEILTEMFNGPDTATSARLILAGHPAVRARTAWALGRAQPESPDVVMLQKLMSDGEPIVQRFALEAIMSATGAGVFEKCLPQIAKALNSDDRIVRLTAAHLTRKLSTSAHASLAALLAGDTRALIWLNLGVQMQEATINIPAARLATSVITGKDFPPELKRDAVRMLQLALGDVGPAEGRAPMFDSYAPQVSLASADLQLNPLRAELAEAFPSGDAELDHELIRVIAMMTPLNRELLTRLLQGITEESSPSDDVHRLAALAQFELERSFDESTATAKALVNIDIKIRQRKMRQDTSWDDRFGELFKALCTVDPAMPQLIADQPGFGEPGHTLFMSQVPQTSVQGAIDRFVARISSGEDFQWTNDVVFILGESSKPEHRELLREQLENLSVRDAVLMVISEKPVKEDRQLFLSGLDSPQLNAVEACVTALTKLPRTNDPAEQYQLLSTARRLVADEREFRIRETVVRLLQNNNGRATKFIFGPLGYRLQPDALQDWQLVLQEKYPQYQPVSQGDQMKRVYDLLSSVNWSAGDAGRGEKLFERLSCARCHGGRRALGPDLTGVTRRFSRNDLFASIIEPNRDISPRYQTTTVAARNGKVFTGLIVYESVDGMLLRDAEHKTYRIEGHDIESRHVQRVSLMPAGLLKDVDAAGLADLYKYLESL